MIVLAELKMLGKPLQVLTLYSDGDERSLMTVEFDLADVYVVYTTNSCNNSNQLLTIAFEIG